MLAEPVRFSRLKRIQQSPAHYICSTEDEPTLARRLGSGTHAVTFGQPYSVFTGKVRRGKAWEAFEEEHADSVIMSAAEYERASRLAEALHNHQDAAQLLFHPRAAVEERIEWNWLGRACAGTPDVRNDSYIVDLKTTRCSEPERFNRDGTHRHYHAQLAWYLDGVVASLLGKPSEAYIVAVESNPPFPVTVMRLTDRALDQGRRLTRLWMERLLQCERANYWPGYVEGIVDFDVLDEPLELVIAGERTLINQPPALGDESDEEDLVDVF